MYIWFEHKRDIIIGHNSHKSKSTYYPHATSQFFIQEPNLLLHLPNEPTDIGNKDKDVFDIFKEALQKVLVKENDVINIIHPTRCVRNYVKWRKQGIFKEELLFRDCYDAIIYRYSFIQECFKQDSLKALLEYGYLKEEVDLKEIEDYCKGNRG